MASSPPPAEASPPPDKGPILQFSPGLSGWLAEQEVSLALTTYQAGRLFFIGRKPDGSLRAHERIIEQCQGLWTDGTTLWASGRTMLWRFRNDLRPGELTEKGAQRRFVPREGRVTGALDIHDIAVGDTGGGNGTTGPIFVATAYNCLATISDEASFRPLWRPSFISALIGEDRCHLNGLAMDGGRPAYASSISRSDVADAWRERRRDGGVVLDIASGEIVAAGLSMPHSPRLYDGRLWILNSGRGEFGWIDRERGEFVPVAFCPGYARGLAFVGRYAVVGISRPRENRTFEGLELEERLVSKDTEPRCGLLVIDIDRGTLAHWCTFEHTIDELYDVAVLPGVAQAEAVGFVGEGIGRIVRPENGSP